MLINKTRYGVLAVILAMALAAAVPAQDSPDSATKAEMMAKAMEMAVPGPEHATLEKMAGDWNIVVKLWMQPGVEPMVASGTAHHEMILGGRFLQCTSTSGEGDMLIETLQIFGFDRRSSMFTVAGYDTWGTYFVNGAGPMHDDKRGITLSGEDYDPMFGFTQKYDWVLGFVDNDHFSMSVIFKNPENTFGLDEFKMVEVN
ncbi:MAG: DUF1579 domain-containing protein, partial [candidate division Zixibacteria bacterium]|nr:DUF1579 domain-containing protein [candidate division Zixibacteria bacterium]